VWLAGNLKGTAASAKMICKNNKKTRIYGLKKKCTFFLEILQGGLMTNLAQFFLNKM